jgi:hypothetical protein
MKLSRLPFANHMPTTTGFLLLFSLDLAADVPRRRLELFPKLRIFLQCCTKLAPADGKHEVLPLVFLKSILSQ